tara:strand:+ start:485 stop:997 length:513 start_codon:yes stop_codon:yes gene_type:complete
LTAKNLTGNYESMMVAWSEIDTVMFDMDGSLLDLHFDNFFWLKLVPEHFSKQHGVSEKQALLVTNARPISLQLKMQHVSIEKYFKQLISSHQLKKAKENDGFWESLQQLFSYDPTRTALFDDNMSVLRQAHREGIAHLRAIKQPDSQQPSLPVAEFPQVEDFGLIAPDEY